MAGIQHSVETMVMGTFTNTLNDLLAGQTLAGARQRQAKRRQPYRCSGPCQCPGCAEDEQLNEAARWHPEMTVRVMAMTFIGAINAVQNGAAGTISLRDCFD